MKALLDEIRAISLERNTLGGARPGRQPSGFRHTCRACHVAMWPGCTLKLGISSSSKCDPNAATADHLGGAQQGPHLCKGWRFSYSRAVSLVILCQGAPFLAPTTPARAQRQSVGSTFFLSSSKTLYGSRLRIASGT